MLISVSPLQNGATFRGSAPLSPGHILMAPAERTDSLNLFFCFRWILISFKREFAFDQVIRLWEVLWTNYYSNHFNLFVALAILQSHRDVLIRYLTEFDEVLKYANDLSGTVSCSSQCLWPERKS